MGFLGRIVDAIDNTVTDARVHAGAQRDARRATANIREGDTVFVTNTYNTVLGPKRLVQEYTVGRGRRVGSDTVEGLYLRNEEVSTRRPRGRVTVQEFTDYEVAGPDAGKAVDQPKRAKAGARR